MSRKRQKNRTGDDDNGFAEWGGYMEAKKAKLSEQFDVVSANIRKKSDIFEGVSILVNGYTQPSADELKFLMAEHGGRYHLYQNQKGVTTHIIATNLPNIKVNQGNIPVVSPKWITDSIEADRLLDFKKYLLYTNESKTQPKLKFVQTNEIDKQKYAKTANDPEFLSEFYNNSRLHLISTLGAEFKQLVNELREKSQGDFPGLIRLFKNPNATKISKSKDVVMHIDMDCFFVSVGLRNRPDLKGKPVAVTHSRTGQINRKNDIQPELDRLQDKYPKLQNLDNKSSMSEIASCSYEARQCGVHNGMLMGAALKLCPNLIPIPYDFNGYKEISHILYNTIAEYTVDIEAVSCDEMYVDVSKILQKTGITIEKFADHIRNEIISKTGCPCSTGFGSNRLQARMATKKAKPNGQFYLKPGDVEEYFKEILLEDLPGVGWSTLTKLNNLGLKTCGDLQNISIDTIKSELGNKTSQLLYEHSRGIDTKPLNFEHERKSVSADINYGIRFKNHDEALKFLESLSNEVFSRLTDLKMKSKCLTLKLLTRAKDAPVETPKYLGCGVCDSLSRSITTSYYLDSAQSVFKEAKGLYLKLKFVPEDLRGVGVQLSRLEKSVVMRKDSVLTKFLKNDVPKNPVISKVQEKSTSVNLLKKPIISKEVHEKSSFSNLTDYFKSGKAETSQRNETVKKKQMNVDMSILKELPEEIQNEIKEEYDLKPIEKPTIKKTKGFSDLSHDNLRVLLRNWIMTELEPKEIDVDMLGDFLKMLAVNREIEKLFPLVKFIHRHINKMSCDWHEAYFKLVTKLQEGMRESFGNPLYVLKKFSCDKHSQ